MREAVQIDLAALGRQLDSRESLGVSEERHRTLSAVPLAASEDGGVRRAVEDPCVLVRAANAGVVRGGAQRYRSGSLVGPRGAADRRGIHAAAADVDDQWGARNRRDQAIASCLDGAGVGRDPARIGAWDTGGRGFDLFSAAAGDGHQNRRRDEAVPHRPPPARTVHIRPCDAHGQAGERSPAISTSRLPRRSAGRLRRRRSRRGSPA